MKILPQFKDLLEEIGKKPNWGAKELLHKLNSVGESISQQMINNGSATVVEANTKKTKVEFIKKYDVLYLALIGHPHYFLVHQVNDETVSGIVFSSKNKSSHMLHEIKLDRHFIGTFGTNTYLSIPLEEAKSNFVRVYENKHEADDMFKKVKEHYKNVLKLK